MMKIISKAISLANAPMLTEPELLVRARDWADELHGIVPMEALNAAMHRAFQNHKSGFPVNAYDLKIAYGELQFEAATIDESRTLSTDEKVEKCTNKENHVDGTFGMIELFIPPDISSEVPCGRCRPDEYTEARQQLMTAVMGMSGGGIKVER